VKNKKRRDDDDDDDDDARCVPEEKFHRHSARARASVVMRSFV
jgi:hypothetical protein